VELSEELRDLALAFQKGLLLLLQISLAWRLLRRVLPTWRSQAPWQWVPPVL
jgi:hypothetical protein